MNPLVPAICLMVILASEPAGAALGGGRSYRVSGSDRFNIGYDAIRSVVSYQGSEVLTVTPHGHGTRLRARVTYTRNDGEARTAASGEFVADLSPSGETVATADHDPDTLTILNQPFAAKLENGTLRDIQRLRGPLPFDFPSPFTRSSLHGYLTHIAGAKHAPRATVGVRFEAAGAMHGALPDRPGLTLSGTIAMRGTAFYDAASAMLVALTTTVTVSGTVSDNLRSDPVKIVYERKLRAQSARSAPTPISRRG